MKTECEACQGRGYQEINVKGRIKQIPCTACKNGEIELPETNLDGTPHDPKRNLPLDQQGPHNIPEFLKYFL